MKKERHEYGRRVVEKSQDRGWRVVLRDYNKLELFD